MHCHYHASVSAACCGAPSTEQPYHRLPTVLPTALRYAPSGEPILLTPNKLTRLLDLRCTALNRTEPNHSILCCDVPFSSVFFPGC